LNDRWTNVVQGVKIILAQITGDDMISCLCWRGSQVEVVTSYESGDSKTSLATELSRMNCDGKVIYRDALKLTISKVMDLQALVEKLGDKRRHIIITVISGPDTTSKTSLNDINHSLSVITKIKAARPIFIGVDITSTDEKEKMQGLKQACTESDLFQINSSQIVQLFQQIISQYRTPPELAPSQPRHLSSPSSSSSSTISPRLDVDALWNVMVFMHETLKQEYLNLEGKLSKPSDLPGFYTCLAIYESKINSIAQGQDWIRYKRKQWLAHLQDSSSYSVAHWATCVLACECDIKPEAQELVWIAGVRDKWVKACFALGARKMQFHAPQEDLGLQLFAALLSGGRLQ